LIPGGISNIVSIVYDFTRLTLIFFLSSLFQVPRVDAPYVFISPPGLRLEESFVSEEEEKDLLAWIDYLCGTEETTGMNV
jgi:hypothetical protein